MTFQRAALTLLVALSAACAHAQVWRDVTPPEFVHYITDIESHGPYLGLRLVDTYVVSDVFITERDYALLFQGHPIFLNENIHDSGEVFHQPLFMVTTGQIMDWVSYPEDDSLKRKPGPWIASLGLDRWDYLDAKGVDTTRYRPHQQRLFRTFDRRYIHFGERKGPLITLSDGTSWNPTTINDIVYKPHTGEAPIVNGYADRGETIVIAHGMLDGDTTVQAVASIVEIEKFTGEMWSLDSILAGRYVYGCFRTLTNTLVALAGERAVHNTIGRTALTWINPYTHQWSVFLEHELAGATLPIDVSFDKVGRAYVVAGGKDSVYVVDVDANTVQYLPRPPLLEGQNITAIGIHNDSLYASNGYRLFVWEMPVTGMENGEWRMEKLGCEHKNTVMYDVLGRVLPSVEYLGAYYEVCRCGKAALKYR